jgi:hypothetical protein
MRDVFVFAPSGEFARFENSQNVKMSGGPRAAASTSTRKPIFLFTAGAQEL